MPSSSKDPERWCIWAKRLMKLQLNNTWLDCLKWTGDELLFYFCYILYLYRVLYPRFFPLCFDEVDAEFDLGRSYTHKLTCSSDLLHDIN